VGEADNRGKRPIIQPQKSEVRSQKPDEVSVTIRSDAESNRAMDLFGVDHGETTEYDLIGSTGP